MQGEELKEWSGLRKCMPKTGRNRRGPEPFYVPRCPEAFRETRQEQVEAPSNHRPARRNAVRTLLGNVRSTVRYLTICCGSNVSEDRQYG